MIISIILNIRPPHLHRYRSRIHPLRNHHNGADEVIRGAGRLHQASAFGAQGDADGGGDRGGVCALLAAVLHH